MTVPLTDPSRARLRVGVGAVIVVALVALGAAVFVTAVTPSGAVTVAPSVAGAPGADSAAAVVEASVYVHVLGAVAVPGLYRLSGEARVVDAVAAAGGFSDQADPGAVNLARFVTDGEQLRVPTLGEVEASAVTDSASGLININSADAAALDSLPRVGPALAQRIVQWREQHGRFRSVDDLLAVTGIGEATLEGLRSLVTL